jgi:hypothetical protein
MISPLLSKGFLPGFKQLKGSSTAYISTPGKKRIGFYFTTTPPLRMAAHFRKSHG